MEQALHVAYPPVFGSPIESLQKTALTTVQGISFLILFPLTFLSNAFVPVNTLPEVLQWFVNLNPVSHLVTAVRDLANNGTFGADGWWALLGAAVIVLVFAPLTVRAYMRKA